MAPKQKQSSAKKKQEQRHGGEPQRSEPAARGGAQGAPSGSAVVVPRSLLDMPKAWLAVLMGSERLNAAARRALFHTAGTSARLLMVHAPPSTTRRLYRYATGPTPSRAWPAALTRFLQQCAVPPPAADGSGGGLELVLACSTLDDVPPEDEEDMEDFIETLAGADLSTFSKAMLPPDAIKPLFTSLQLRRLVLSTQSMQVLGLPQWASLCGMRMDMCEVSGPQRNAWASPEMTFVAPPNVRALELDVHFKQSSDHEGLATLVRPFGATLEHLCLRIGAYGVEEGAYADFVEFWNDRTATSLLKLCPRLRRLDFPVEMEEDLWERLVAHKSLEHLSAPTLEARDYGDGSARWRDQACAALTCLDIDGPLDVTHVGIFPKLPRLERLVVRGAELQLSNYSSTAAARAEKVTKAQAGLTRLQQWAQSRQQQLGTVLRVVPAQAGAWSPSAEDRLVRLQVGIPEHLVGSGTLGRAARFLLMCCEGPATHLELDSKYGPWTTDALAEVAQAVDEAAGGGGGVHTLCVQLWRLGVDLQPAEAEAQLGQPGAGGAGGRGGEAEGAGGGAAAPAGPVGTVMGALPASIRTLSVAISVQPGEQPSVMALAPKLLPLLRQPRASPLRVVVCTDAELSAANKALIDEVAARQPHLQVGYFVRPAEQRRGG